MFFFCGATRRECCTEVSMFGILILAPLHTAIVIWQTVQSGLELVWDGKIEADSSVRFSAWITCFHCHLSMLPILAHLCRKGKSICSNPSQVRCMLVWFAACRLWVYKPAVSVSTLPLLSTCCYFASALLLHPGLRATQNSSDLFKEIQVMFFSLFSRIITGASRPFSSNNSRL